MDAIASLITSLTIVYSTVYSDADQRKHKSSASRAFVWGIHWGGEFPAQMASNAENVSIWWRHHVISTQQWQVHLGYTVVYAGNGKSFSKHNFPDM